jgi:hypothetical protein
MVAQNDIQAKVLIVTYWGECIEKHPKKGDKVQHLLEPPPPPVDLKSGLDQPFADYPSISRLMKNQPLSVILYVKNVTILKVLFP